MHPRAESADAAWLGAVQPAPGRSSLDSGFDGGEPPVYVLFTAPSVCLASHVRDGKVVAPVRTIPFFRLDEVGVETIIRLHLAEDNVALVN